MSTVRYADGPGEGIGVGFVKSRATIYVYGWYDTIIGIAPDRGSAIDLAVFLADLGVTPKHLQAVLKRWEAGLV